MNRLNDVPFKEPPRYVTPSGLLITVLVVLALVLGVLAAWLPDPALLFAGIIGVPVVLLIVRHPYVGLLLYLCVFLYRPGEVHPALAPLRIELVLGSFLLVMSVIQLRIRTGRVALPRDRISLLLALFFGAMILSLFTSFEKTETINTCRDFAKTIVFYLLIVFLVDNRKKLYVFLATYSVMIVKIVVDSLVAFYSGDVMTVHGVDRLIGATSAGGDPNTLATTLVVSLPLVFVTARLSRQVVPKLVFYLSCIIIVVLVALTGSRGGVLAFLVVLLFSAVLVRQRVPIIAAALILLPLVWVSLPTAYRDRYRGTVAAETLDEASSGRWEIWKSGLSMVVNRPLTGVGAGAYPWAQASGSFGRAKYMQAHNVFIQVAATTGILGLVAWLLLLRHVIAQLYELRKRREDRPHYSAQNIAQALLLSITALLASGIFGHNLYRYHWYLIAALTVVLVRDMHGTIARNGVPGFRKAASSLGTPMASRGANPSR